MNSIEKSYFVSRKQFVPAAHWGMLKQLIAKYGVNQSCDAIIEGTFEVSFTTKASQ